ncbi:DUF1697 domain-containing protein [Methylobacterium brachythecii]|uniref:Uncharacterized protein (DUF1697 family) n=1 Tax=Methylobacterium brachythecii TaxID=1176177 RepID=A0A7W6F5K3_9HYPH|nr:DUF1697 domain-containing protein [Methylobacterium brachythecii]MBB3901447.1 uncharacterized protein (DUF1697 family) [Methylobacterium brachythecii]GLS43019.1 hypothetical protein GCM10007884_10040 [Methylobacterium brachythecii]
MTRFVALLRAVNVGGTGKLAMADLARFCEEAGLEEVRTYIASGNVVFSSDKSAAEVKLALEERLLSHFGKRVGVVVRDAAEMAEVLARNPFPDHPASRVIAIFLDEATHPDMLSRVSGLADEEIRLGRREIYVRYLIAGMGQSKLRIPAAANGTARNMNTVAKLAAMATE